MNIQINIVAINDSEVELHVLRTLAFKILQQSTSAQVKFYTGKNGIEGLGYVFLTKPDIVIIDSTLPEFKGMELLEYLKSNSSKFEEFTSMQVIILSSNPEELNLPPNYTVFDKSHPNFYLNLFTLLNINLYRYIKKLDPGEEPPTSKISLTTYQRWILRVGTAVNLLSVKAGKAAQRHPKYMGEKLLRAASWFYWKSLMELHFLYFILVSGKIAKADLVAAVNGKSTQPTRFYPHAIRGFIAFSLIILQIGAVLWGGYDVFVKPRLKDPGLPKVVVKVISDNGAPLEGAVVQVNSDRRLTPDTGIVTFYNLDLTKSYYVRAEYNGEENSGDIYFPDGKPLNEYILVVGD